MVCHYQFGVKEVVFLQVLDLCQGEGSLVSCYDMSLRHWKINKVTVVIPCGNFEECSERSGDICFILH